MRCSSVLWETESKCLMPVNVATANLRPGVVGVTDLAVGLASAGSRAKEKEGGKAQSTEREAIRL